MNKEQFLNEVTKVIDEVLAEAVSEDGVAILGRLMLCDKLGNVIYSTVTSKHKPDDSTTEELVDLLYFKKLLRDLQTLAEWNKQKSKVV